MLDGIRKFVRKRFEGVSSRRPEELARALAQQGQATREQATRIAHEVVEWSKKNREVITEVVQREVRKQMARLGAATKEEINALRRRVRDLETGGAVDEAAAKKTPAKKVAGKNSATKKTATKKTATKKTATKRAVRQKASPKKPAGRASGATKAAARKSARPAGQA
ncbi:MAG TPA: hypothetical protein VGR49_07475 [Actinomycetota bacterium]|jgi:polyhydroxyalkanoate synthesis regulator phasin|nr:hypothetical protein [Actinomycetota bacterium]